jgi:hypothetical protein
LLVSPTRTRPLALLTRLPLGFQARRDSAEDPWVVEPHSYDD